MADIIAINEQAISIADRLMRHLHSYGWLDFGDEASIAQLRQQVISITCNELLGHHDKLKFEL